MREITKIPEHPVRDLLKEVTVEFYKDVAKTVSPIRVLLRDATVDFYKDAARRVSSGYAPNATKEQVQKALKR